MPFDPLAGTPYRTLGPLGRGAMGEVVDAEHRALGKRVVVKLLHARLRSRPDLVDRMRLEGQALALLQHPNIVAVTDLGFTADDRPFLVMERLRGRTLRDELRARGSIPTPEALGMAAQALAGLAAAHDAGIVHRDVKLENLFVCDAADGAPRALKILDFGLAKVIEVDGEARAPRPLEVPTAEGVALGTPRFFSPEQAAGDPVDGRTDVYAMGAVLYALIAGRGPFEHLHTVAELLDAHLSTPPEPPSRHAPQPVSAALDQAILKALAKLPEDRFQTARAFAGALAAADEPEPIEGDDDGAPPLEAPTRGAFAAAFAIALLLTVVVLALLDAWR